MTIYELLKKHEGLRLKPYKDTVGKLTIGIGRNLDDVGISEEEAVILLGNDLDKVDEITSRIYWYQELTNNRKVVITSMIFNMGYKGFSQFKTMIACIERHDFEGASLAMLDSKWAKQVGKRAEELAEIMFKG